MAGGALSEQGRTRFDALDHAPALGWVRDRGHRPEPARGPVDDLTDGCRVVGQRRPVDRAPRRRRARCGRPCSSGRPSRSRTDSGLARAIQAPPSTSIVVARSSRSTGAGAASAATTRPFMTSSTTPMMGCDARALTRTSSRPPAAGRRRTSPGSWPSTVSSRTGPEDACVRPARTAAAQASNDGGWPGSSRAYVRTPPSGHLGRHLVGAAEDRQPVAAVEEAVPLEDGRVVQPGGERLHLDRVDPAGDDVRRDLGQRQREVRTDHEPALGVAAVRPVGEELHDGRADAALRGATRRHRQDGPAGAEQGQVAEHVLAVLGPEQDHVAAVRRDEVARPQVRDVGELVAELGRQQVDERDVLGGRLEQRGRRRQEVDVRIRGHPAGGHAGRSRVRARARARASPSSTTISVRIGR